MIDNINLMIGQYINDWLALFSYFISPTKRVYWLYLLSGIVMFCLLHRNREQTAKILRTSFSQKYWLNRSSILDLKWIFLNQLIAIIIIIPLLGSPLSWAMDGYRQYVKWFGLGDFFQWQPSIVTALFTLTLFVVDDFSRFIVHFAYHKIPWLWRFHAIHHSAKVMTPLTLYRVHFVEYFFNSLRAVSVIGLVSGIFIYCFKGNITVFDILGVSMFNFCFNLLGANLRHSHVWLGFGKFEQWFISPAQHQLHHSSAKRHLDKNFGASLAIWDRLFSCWVASKDETKPSFGLYRQRAQQLLTKQLLGIANK